MMQAQPSDFEPRRQPVTVELAKRSTFHSRYGHLYQLRDNTGRLLMLGDRLIYQPRRRRYADGDIRQPDAICVEIVRQSNAPYVVSVKTPWGQVITPRPERLKVQFVRVDQRTKR